jgi:hypothetical protein
LSTLVKLGELAGCLLIEDPASGGFVGGGDQDADALQLQLRILASSVICRYGGPQAVAAQQADDQFRLRTAGNDGQRHGQVIHDLLLGIMAAVPGGMSHPVRWSHLRAASGASRQCQSWKVSGVTVMN